MRRADRITLRGDVRPGSLVTFMDDFKGSRVRLPSGRGWWVQNNPCVTGDSPWCIAPELLGECTRVILEGLSEREARDIASLPADMQEWTQELVDV